MLAFLKKFFKNKSSVSSEISQLMDKEKKFLKVQNALQTQIDKQIKIAKINASKNKREALQALRVKRNLEVQLNGTEYAIQNIRRQISMINFTKYDDKTKQTTELISNLSNGYYNEEDLIEELNSL